MTTSVFHGTTLYVSASIGSNSTGKRGLVDHPFLTIQAAVDAASAGDTVLVLPGTYSGAIVCKNDVSIVGTDPYQCKITRTPGASENVVLMADRMVFENFFMTITANGGVAAEAIHFTGSTHRTSTARNIIITSAGAGVVRTLVDGDAAAPTGIQYALDNVWILGTGFSNGHQHGGGGSTPEARYRNCVFSGLLGFGNGGGVAYLASCRVIGIGGLNLTAGTVTNVDAATSWIATTGTGVLQKDQFALGLTTQTIQSTSTVAVDNVTPTIISTLASINAQGNVVHVHFSGIFENTAATRNLSLRLFKDGVEVSATDRYAHRLESTDDSVTISCHWVDPAYPLIAPVYTVRALGDNTGINALTNRRATATLQGR